MNSQIILRILNSILYLVVDLSLLLTFQSSWDSFWSQIESTMRCNSSWMKGLNQLSVPIQSNSLIIIEKFQNNGQPFRSLDVETLTALDRKVNLIPLIAKETKSKRNVYIQLADFPTIEGIAIFFSSSYEKFIIQHYLRRSMQ